VCVAQSTRGARTVGVDIEPALLAIAREAAARERLEVQWLTGDAEQLPLGDGAVDVAMSLFGVMYAPDHDAAAAELARVTMPHGRVVLASWRPGSFLPSLGQVFAAYLPAPPPSSGPPSRWGDLQGLEVLLRNHGLHVDRHAIGEIKIAAASLDEAAEFLICTAGHVVAEREALVNEGRWTDLQQDVVRFLSERATKPHAGPLMRLEYLLAVAVPER